MKKTLSISLTIFQMLIQKDQALNTLNDLSNFAKTNPSPLKYKEETTK